MPAEKRETAVSGDTVRWLQDEADRAKTQLAKLEQQVEQQQALLSELVDRTRHQDESIAALAAQSTAIASMQEAVHEAKATAAKLQEEQENARDQTEEVVRQHQADIERTRQERAEVAQSVQQVERQLASSLERQTGVEETAQRYQQAAAQSDLRINALEQQIEELRTRTGRAVEAVNRLEQRAAEMGSAIESMVRASESESERVRLVSEVVRRVEGDLETQKRQAESLTKLLEGMELQRVQRQRLESRASQLDQMADDLRARVEEQQRILSVLEGKHHGYEGRLDALNERLEQHRQQLADYLLKLTQNQEQLKRRQIDDLERELKELQQYALNLFGE